MRAITLRMPDHQPTPAPSPPGASVKAGRSSGPAAWWLLGALLVAAVIWAGSPALDAPWIQGDERIFIAKNPDVTGIGHTQPTWSRWLRIFGHAHEDLYQPVTILTYAIEWSLWGENRIFHMRLTDVLIHALNALLLWAVFRALLRRFLGQDDASGATAVGWALACVWALHPMLVGAYAADMGRTHLLAATFTFASLLLHLKSLEPGRWGWFLGAYAALLLAMLNKPMVGWVVVIFVLEWTLLGLRRTLLSARIYLIGAACAAFAVLTLWTTKETLLVEDSPLPLFGDPVARAALGLWIYVRNFVAPLGWLSAWYPPDIHTGWGHPAVWLGVLLTVIATLAALLAARRTRTRGITLGLVWCWAMWLPVSGLVGARVLAAQDRYMYQPMVGLLLVIGVGLLYWVQAGGVTARYRQVATVAVALLAGIAALPRDLTLCRHARSTLRRAQRAVDLNPGDPRVMEFMAAACEFSIDHDTPEAHLPEPPDFPAEMKAALLKAAQLAEQNPHYFGDNYSRAAFHRRLSFRLWNMGAYESSLAQAQRAHDFEPEAKLTWVRLAHAYRSLQRWEDARQAFEKLLEVMPDDAPDYALRYTEFADLLLIRLNDPSEALYKYRQALLSPKITPAAQRIAWLGAARCEVLAGKGSDGFELAREVLRVEPENLEAWRIIALYHLRSHHWDEADAVCRQVLTRYPTDYETLRRFQNVCAIRNNWHNAAFAWQDAWNASPANLTYRSCFVWAAACAAEESASTWANELLEVAPGNRFACLALMLVAIRDGALDEALAWLRRATQGSRLPEAHELAQAELAVRLMIERQELPSGAVLLQAALAGQIGKAADGRNLVQAYLEANPDGRWRALGERILEEDLGAETAP